MCIVRFVSIFTFLPIADYLLSMIYWNYRPSPPSRPFLKDWVSLVYLCRFISRLSALIIYLCASAFSIWIHFVTESLRELNDHLKLFIYWEEFELLKPWPATGHQTMAASLPVQTRYEGLTGDTDSSSHPVLQPCDLQHSGQRET